MSRRDLLQSKMGYLQTFHERFYKIASCCRYVMNEHTDYYFKINRITLQLS